MRCASETHQKQINDCFKGVSQKLEGPAKSDSDYSGAQNCSFGAATHSVASNKSGFSGYHRDVHGK